MKVAAVKKPGGPGNLIIEDRADPKPAVGEILVRIYASSLNYHDFVVVMGGIPTDDSASFKGVEHLGCMKTQH